VAAIQKSRIPVFSLYGETDKAAATGFAHVEPVSLRARRHGWNIDTHRHSHLAQAVLIDSGSGHASLDDFSVSFSAPWLIWIPPGTVHSFAFEPSTDGAVFTVSVDYLTGTLAGSPNEARLRAAADRVVHGQLPSAEDIGIDFRQLIASIEMETTGEYSCADSAIAAALKLLLIGVMRMATINSTHDDLATARSALFRRFRRMVDRTFREQWPIARLAREIGVSADRLHAICHDAVGKSPRALLHERLILEAKRNLRYTALPISAIAFDLGFRDQAYFSRFFTKRVGLSPLLYRRANTTTAIAKPSAEH
jgi:AraC family transcriptional activator of pobA